MTNNWSNLKITEHLQVIVLKKKYGFHMLHICFTDISSEIFFYKTVENLGKMSKVGVKTIPPTKKYYEKFLIKNKH